MCNFPEYSKDRCVGCGACELICPFNCIKMESDEEGFLYPTLDTSRCTNCGVCRSHCPIVNETRQSEQCQAYGFIHKNEKVLMDSTSGGAFTAFAEYTLSNKGIVYGTSFNDKVEAITVPVQDINDLPRLRGSKYVQSDNNKQYIKIKTDLESGRSVLHCGTPCQIAGLKAFLKCDYPDLFLIDLFCHGTPSPLLFKKYIEWLSKKEKNPVASYQFRKKEFGWGTIGEYTTLKKTKIVISSNDPYYFAFLIGKTYRPVCYKCKYASPRRPGDVSIGDFWGVEKSYPDIPIKQGVSAILINTDKGISLFNKIKESGYYFHTTFSRISCQNTSLLYPTKQPKTRDMIYKQLKAYDFERLSKKYLYHEHPIITKLKDITPKSLKTLVKKILILFK